MTGFNKTIRDLQNIGYVNVVYIVYKYVDKYVNSENMINVFIWMADFWQKRGRLLAERNDLDVLR